mmetsp:Transcript_46922/g.101976  ORF Transcript_46922/g.101976 Transcript_46922/m.101976 type:complete len:458 (-) Transcript_46922:267-1640(-)
MHEFELPLGSSQTKTVRRRNAASLTKVTIADRVSSEADETKETFTNAVVRGTNVSDTISFFSTGATSVHMMRAQNLNWRLASAQRNATSPLPSCLRGLPEDHPSPHCNSPDLTYSRFPSLQPSPLERRLPPSEGLCGLLQSSRASSPIVRRQRSIRSARSERRGETPSRRPSWKELSKSPERRGPMLAQENSEPSGLTPDTGSAPEQEEMKMTVSEIPKRTVSFADDPVEVPIFTARTKRSSRRPRTQEDISRANFARLMANHKRVMKSGPSWRKFRRDFRKRLYAGVDRLRQAGKQLSTCLSLMGTCHCALNGDVLMLGRLPCVTDSVVLLAGATVAVQGSVITIAVAGTITLGLLLDSVTEAEQWAVQIKAASTLLEETLSLTEMPYDGSLPYDASPASQAKIKTVQPSARPFPEMPWTRLSAWEEGKISNKVMISPLSLWMCSIVRAIAPCCAA